MNHQEPSPRHHALDGVRATAMLLGVVYHALLFRMIAGGQVPARPEAGGAAHHLQEWLHSFRMPLFFLISGFFGRLTLEKYGTGLYLRKRWSRIGIPLFVGMFTFCPAYVLTREAISPGPGPGPGGPPSPGAAGLGGFELPPPPPGFVPPPLVGFDRDSDGTLSESEWKEARAELEKMIGDGGRMPFGPPGGGLGDRLFGASSRLFQLNHLWFLWYLLIFSTIAPAVTKALGRANLRPPRNPSDRFGEGLIRSGFAPVVLGLVATPPLLLAAGPFGWSLGLPASIFRAFPDFLPHLDPDMAVYFVFFLSGWWLHREREAIPGLSRGWLPCLVLGSFAFAGSTWLGETYGGRSGLSNYGMIRLAGFTLYGISSAATGFAFLGFFRKYLDRPNAVGRYLSDTALWVYLVHQPFVLVGLAWLAPTRWPWWALTASVSVLAVAASLFLFEALVRPTPLIRAFGPARLAPRTPEG